MTEYHKIQSVYLRDPANKHKTFLEGQWAMPEFGYLADLDWVWTEKINGTNIRVMWDGVLSVRFGGKTDDAQIPTFLLAHLQDTFTAESLGMAFSGPAVLYGEGYGPKIQKGGGNYRDDPGFILFDVNCGMWLERGNVEDIAAKLFIPIVPIIGVGPLSSAISVTKARLQSLVAKVPGTWAEGLVMRPAVELLTRRGDRIITKVKTKDFE